MVVADRPGTVERTIQGRVSGLVHFVAVYDRMAGLKALEKFAEASAALARRFELERSYWGDARIEIALLSAESEEALHVTHTRYFRTANELVADTRDAARDSMDRLARPSPSP